MKPLDGRATRYSLARLFSGIQAAARRLCAPPEPGHLHGSERRTSTGLHGRGNSVFNPGVGGKGFWVSDVPLFLPFCLSVFFFFPF